MQYASRGLLVLSLESFDAPGSIDQFLFARKEPVAFGTNFNMKLAVMSGLGRERVTARTGDGNVFVFRMNFCFH